MPQEKLRRHCVSPRLNDDELAELDAMRGAYQRGEWMRMATFSTLPPSVPEINREAWATLARAAGNLATLGDYLRGGGEATADAIRAELSAFRLALITTAIGDRYPLTGEIDGEEFQ